MQSRIFFILILVVLSFNSFGQKKRGLKPDENGVYVVEEEMPEYPGGDKELMKFVGANLAYPPEAKRLGITGKVYVGYVVNKRGKVVKVKIAKAVHKLLDKEAIRVVKLLKYDKPGYQNGKPVNVKFTIPFNFR